MKKIIEHWKNENGDREDHYHLDKARREYLFGFNPKYVTKTKLKKILKIIDND